MLEVMLYIAVVPRGYSYLTPIGPILDIIFLGVMSVFLSVRLYKNLIGFKDVFFGLVASLIVIPIRFFSFDYPEIWEMSFLFIAILSRYVPEIIKKNSSDSVYLILLSLTVIAGFLLKGRYYFSSDFFDSYGFFFVFSYGAVFLLAIILFVSLIKKISCDQKMKCDQQ
jgi:hypothetical protein